MNNLTRVGVTGARFVMPRQLTTLYRVLDELNPRELHHGCCVGTDWLAHLWAKSRAWDPDKNVIETGWPGHDRNGESPHCFQTAGEGMWVEDPLPYLVRNRLIVRHTDILVACPLNMFEEVRSRTWATVRYARKLGRPVIYCWPNGWQTRDEGKLAGFLPSTRETGGES